MPVRSRRIFSLLLVACGLALMLHPAAAHSSAPVVLINEFVPDPSGSDINKEWVELFNPNPVAVNISNWKIDDNNTSGSEAPTIIDSNITISSNSLLVITLTGSLLGNGVADTIQLLDATGNQIDSYDYTVAPSNNQSFARTPDGGVIWAQGVPSQGGWNSDIEPTPAPTYTPTQPPTNTATPTNTTIPTLTDTPTNTSKPTDMAMPTNTPTFTPSPTTTPYPTDILINEFLANPKTLYSNEWIELYNAGSSAVDLAGWKLA
jgi:hypothetical protein